MCNARSIRQVLTRSRTLLRPISVMIFTYPQCGLGMTRWRDSESPSLKWLKGIIIPNVPTRSTQRLISYWTRSVKTPILITLLVFWLRSDRMHAPQFPFQVRCQLRISSTVLPTWRGLDRVYSQTVQSETLLYCSTSSRLQKFIRTLKDWTGLQISSISWTRILWLNSLQGDHVWLSYKSIWWQSLEGCKYLAFNFKNKRMLGRQLASPTQTSISEGDDLRL